MTARLRASVVVIGDEILGGFVRDSNSGWLAVRLRELGIPLDRIVTVPDTVPAIGEALTGELGRGRPRVVLTSGGIGSTPDDVTFEAVAAALGTGLRVEPHIDARISAAAARSRERGAPLSEEHVASMRKMARVPEPARLLPGGDSLQPGVALDVDAGAAAADGATVVILAGVPSELRRTFDEAVVPALLEGRGLREHAAELTHGYPESALNPVFERIVTEFPDVHLGSYPGRECIVRLKGAEQRVDAAMALVTAYLEALGADPSADALARGWRRRWSQP